jgi:hypothetical protein
MAAMPAGLRGAAVVTASVIASFLLSYWVSSLAHAGNGAAILSATLALTLARRPALHHVRKVLVELAMLPLVALVASAVGLMLRAMPILGATAFVAGMFLSVWLRQFGAAARRAGLLLGLPLVAILVAPGAPHAAGGRVVDVGLVLLAGISALGWVLLFQTIAAHVNLAPPYEPEAPPRERKASAKKGLSSTTRMAIQLAVALALAFVVGRVWFAQHAMWVVLTAYIVCASSRGRGDVLYKSLLRFFGAAAGTIAAALLQHASLPQGAQEAALIFAALFVGTWLRGLSYAYWAACITLVVALLQRGEAGTPLSLLDLRLVEILVGGLCGVAAAWFVLPIRTESVVLRRLADALAALSDVARVDYAAAKERERAILAFERDVKLLDAVAAPVRLHRHTLGRRRDGDEHAAEWIGAAHACALHARRYRGDREQLAWAVGAARKALARRAHPDDGESGDATLIDALRRVQRVLSA